MKKLMKPTLFRSNSPSSPKSAPKATSRATAVVCSTLLSSAMLALSGCATTGGGHTEDKAAAERSKAFLESVSPVRADMSKSVAKCAMPSDKPAPPPEPGKLGKPSKDWREMVAAANGCVNAKNWKILEALGNAMAKSDIDSPWGAYYLSVAAEGSGDLSRALWMVELAQKKAGGLSGLFAYQKARIFATSGEVTKAMTEMKRAVDLEPKMIDAHLYLAEIHHRDQEMQQAEKHYVAALAADAKSYRVLSGLAEVQLSLGKPEAAVDTYSKAISAHPAQLRPWVRLGYIYESVQKNESQALATYKGLKSSLDSGSIKEKPDFDLNSKIKNLEDQAVARMPAQAAATPKTEGPAERSTK